MTSHPGDEPGPDAPDHETSRPAAGETPAPGAAESPGGEDLGYWERQAREQASRQQYGHQYGPQYGQPQYGQPQQGYGQQGYAQYPSYPPPPPGYPAYGPGTAPNHPQATTSMVLGIVSLAGALACVLPIFLAPVAWVMGQRTVREIDASGGRWGGRGQAQAGYVLGVVGTVLLGLFVLFVAFIVVLAVTGNLDDDPTSTTSTTAAAW